MSTLPMYLVHLYFRYFHVSPVCQFSKKTLFLEVSITALNKLLFNYFSLKNNN